MAQKIVLNSVLRNLFVVVGIVGDNKRSVLFICWTKVFLSHFRVFYKAGTQLLWHFLAIPFSFSFYLYSLLSNYIFVRFFSSSKWKYAFGLWVWRSVFPDSFPSLSSSLHIHYQRVFEATLDLISVCPFNCSCFFFFNSVLQKMN